MADTAKVARNTLFGLFTNVAIFVSSRVSGIIIARHLGPEANGIYQYLHTLIETVVLLITGPLTYTNVVFLANLIGEGRERSAWAVHRLSLLYGMLLGGLVLAVASLYPELLGRWFASPETYLPYLAMCGWAVCLWVPVHLFASAALGWQQFGTLSLANGLGLTAWMGLNVGIWYVGGGVGAFVASLAGMFLLQLVVYCWRFRSQMLAPEAARLLPGDLRRWLTPSLPNFALMATDLILWKKLVEMYLLEQYATPADNGFYSNGYNFAVSLMGMVPGAFSAVLLPVFAEKFGANRPDELARAFRRGSKYLALLAIPLGFVAAPLGKPGILLLFGEEYAPTATVFSVTVLAMTLYALRTGLSYLVMSSRKPLPLALANLALSGVMIGVLHLSVSRWGLWGALGGKVSVQVLAGLVEVALLVRLTGLRYPFGEVSRILGASLLALGGTWAATAPLMAVRQDELWCAGVLVVGGLAGALSGGAGLRLFRVLTVEDSRLLAPLAERHPLGRRAWPVLTRLLVRREGVAF